MNIKTGFLRVFAKIMVFCVAVTGVFYTANADEITCPAGQILHTYESATGTVTQNGTPSPTNPVYPTFYTQGDMTLRALKNTDDTYKDSYDSGTIIRRVAVRAFDGTEGWDNSNTGDNFVRYTVSGFKEYPNIGGSAGYGEICSHFPYQWQWQTVRRTGFHNNISIGAARTIYHFEILDTDPLYESVNTLEKWKTWLANQAAAGTPVTVYYLLAEPEEENWATTSYCAEPIKIATNAYNDAQFSPVETALNTAVSTIKDVVSNTITQTAAIAQIASDKQTRPDSECPAGKTCLLIEDANGDPHWYEIITEYIPPEPAPVEP